MVSANRARGLDQDDTHCRRSCFFVRGLFHQLSAFTVLFNYTKTYHEKYLVLALSRGD